MPTSAESGILNAITMGEAHAMIAACRTDRDRLLLSLLWATGGRVSEVLALKPGDLLAVDTIRLLNEKQEKRKKGDDSPRPTHRKVIYVPTGVVKDIEAFAHGSAASAFVFPGRNPQRHLSRVQAWRICKRAAETAGVMKLLDDGRSVAAWTHLFRHGAAVNLLRQGIGIAAIKDQLGHKSLKSTDTYARLFNEDRRKQLSTVEV